MSVAHLVSQHTQGRYRFLKNCAFDLPFNFWDATVGPPKLNGAGSPVISGTTICKDNASSFSALTAGGASTVTQEIGNLSIIAADMTFDTAAIRIAGTLALSPFVIRIDTEPCMDSGNAVEASSTVNKLRLRAGANATDDYFRGCLLEIVIDKLEAPGDPQVLTGVKRIIYKYVGADKDAFFLTPLPLDPSGQTIDYKITPMTPGEFKAQLLHEAMVRYGRITSGGATTGGVSTELDGFGANAFLNSAAIIGSQDANQGLIRRITGYTTASGTFVWDALPATVNTNDLLILAGSFGTP